MIVTTSSEAFIADQTASTGRSCGSCSLCCKLLQANDPPFFKPAGKWCEHCRPGNGGCAIYNQRPELCRAWVCGWLLHPTVGDEWQPTRSKMVINGEAVDQATQQVWCNIHVDPGTPDAWRREPYHSQLRAWALNGLRGPDGVTVTTRVTVGRRVFIILPDDDVEVTDRHYAVAPVGPDRWHVFRFDSEQQAKRVISTKDRVAQVVAGWRQRGVPQQQIVNAGVGQPTNPHEQELVDELMRAVREQP